MIYGQLPTAGKQTKHKRSNGLIAGIVLLVLSVIAVLSIASWVWKRKTANVQIQRLVDEGGIFNIN